MRKMNLIVGGPVWGQNAIFLGDHPGQIRKVSTKTARRFKPRAFYWAAFPVY